MANTWLMVLRSATLISRHQLVNQRVTVGRGYDCDVILHGDGVSRHHAEFVVQDDGWIIRDLASRNGVRVNGTSIADAWRISAGDVIEIDEFELRIHHGATVGDDPFDPARPIQETAPPRPAPVHLSSLLAFNAA